jgi:hypothetical protein
MKRGHRPEAAVDGVGHASAAARIGLADGAAQCERSALAGAPATAYGVPDDVICILTKRDDGKEGRPDGRDSSRDQQLLFHGPLLYHI